MTKVRVRPAVAADAGAAAAMMRASIAMLCTDDHQNAPETIANWTANKTPEMVGGWIADGWGRVFTAEIGGAMAAFGSVSKDGEVLLNYVAPEFRFQGASRALLHRLEAEMAGRGVAEGRLTSTRTAQRFYRSAGWSPDQAGTSAQGIPMTKTLPMVRRLGAPDAEAFREIRLEALQTAPDAYGSTYDNWKNAGPEAFAARLAGSVVLGVWDGGQIVGIAALDRDKGGNARHRAYATSVYVQPASRGRGLAAALLAGLAAGAADAGVLQIELHVASGNDAAIRAYEAAGFHAAGTVPRALLSGGRFIDEVHMIRRLDGTD